MKKFIIFLSILLIGLIGFLIYLVGWPYLSEYLKSRKTNVADANIIQGNFVGGAVIVDTNSINSNVTENNIPKNETNEVSTDIISNIVSKMSKDEIDLYNISFTGYEGKNMNGQMVKVLLEEVYRSNNYNVGKPGLFVSVTQDYIDRIDSKIGEPGDTDNNYNKVSKANSKIMDLKDETKQDGTYDIECKYDSGLVVEVHITKTK